MSDTRISADTIRRRYLERLHEHLSKADADRLADVLGLLDKELHSASIQDCLGRLFPKRKHGNALADLRLFRDRLRKASTKAGLTLTLEVDSRKRLPAAQRSCWFEAEDTLMADVAEFSRQVVADVSNTAVIQSQAVASTGVAMESGKPLVPLFLSAAPGEEKLAGELLEKLKVQLGGSRRFVYDAWDRAKILLGETTREEQLKAFERAKVMLVLASPALIGDSESRSWVSLAKQNRRLICPVRLKTISEKHDLGELEGFEHFSLNGRSYQDCSPELRDRFAQELFENIEERLEKEARNEPLPELLKVLAPLECLRYIENTSRGVSLDVDTIEVSSSEAQGQPAVELLLDWATDDKAPPFAVVLGECGIGKTTTLKQVTHKLLKRYEEDPSTPLPVYIDLRAYSDTIHKRAVPKLEDFLTEILHHPWMVPHAPLLEAKAVLDLVRTKGGLLIFDGLDEKLVHLDDAQGRAFVRELWGALPPQLHRSGAVAAGTRPGKLLFSCRSHYFKTIRDQASFLCGERRDSIRAVDYRACILLPFDEKQVRKYLEQVLDPERAEAALKLFSQIHNLQDLSRRPYLLSLIVPQIAKLESRRSQGEPLLGVSLYDMLVEEWLNRDDGKHTIQKEDKLRLMEDMAAALWRDGSREWPWASVRDWLGQRVAGDEVMRARYLGDASKSAILDEDFRTATLVLRPDDSADSFRFAHTSLHEYFLARFLFQALVAGQPQYWALPMPSDETLDFLGQLIFCECRADRQGKCKQALRALLATFDPQATLAAFKYWLLAIERKLPEPAPGRVDLHGADLSGWHIQGRDNTHRLPLRGADLSGARLRQTSWRWVDLQGANFRKAKLWGADLQQVGADGLDVTGADLTATVWRRSSLRDLRGGENAEHYAASFVDCRLDLARTGSDFLDLATLVRCFDGDQPVGGVGIDRRLGLLYLRRGNGGVVLSCAFSSDGRQVVSGSFDRTAKVWDAASGECVATLIGHGGWIWSCAFSPDGSRVVSGSVDGTVKVWDAVSGECVATLGGHGGGVRSCAFSPDGSRVVSGSADGAVKVWDAASGECATTLVDHGSGIWSCGFSPDGSRVVSSSDDGTAKVWDVATGECVAVLSGHGGRVTSCSFSSDGNRVASGSTDGTVKVWDARRAECMATLSGHGQVVWSCAFSPDGSRVVSGSEDGTAKVWNAATGECVVELIGHGGGVMSCGFSPDGSRVVSGSEDSTVKVWDTGSGECVATLSGYGGWIGSCGFSPDGSRVVSGSDDKTVKVWDAGSGECMATLVGHRRVVRSCAFSPDGSQMVSGSDDGTVKVWDTASGECVATLSGHGGRVWSCAFSPDGRRVVSGSDDKMVKVWDAGSKECVVTLVGHGAWVWSCAFSPDGRRVVSGSDDSTVKVWDAGNGECVATLSGHGGGVRACAFSPDGSRVFSGSDDSTMKVWDVSRRECVATLSGLGGSIISYAFSQDGRRAVSGSADSTVKLWDAESGECVMSLIGHGGGVSSCGFSPDGRRVVSGSDDGTVKVWDTQTGQEILTLVNGPNGETAAVDFANNRILRASAEAWRFLSWRFFDPKRGMHRLFPVDIFEPLQCAG